MNLSFPRRARGRVGATAAVLAVAALALSACASAAPAAAPSGDAAADGFGDLTVQLSWIKNEEFAGEFFADSKGYYAEAGFDSVTSSRARRHGRAELVSGAVRRRAQRRRLHRRGRRRARTRR